MAERNIKEWFDGRIKFEGHVRDITDDRFDDLLIEDSFVDGGAAPLNLVLFFGGTIACFRQPDEALRVIEKSMGKDDLLLYSKKLDTDSTRQELNLNTGDHDPKKPLNEQFKLPIELLNIDESWYDVEKGFDEKERARYMRIRLKVSLSMKFELNGRHRMVELKKNDTILVWRARHQNALDVIQQFEHNGFNVLNTVKTRDNEYMFLAAEIRTGADGQGS